MESQETMNNSIVVELKNIKKDYHLGKTIVHALKSASLSIHKGDFVTIMGPSGSGKSTLLNMIGCLDRPTQGDLRIENKSMSDMSEQELTRLRAKKIGFVFQNFSLIPILTVEENIEYVLINNRVRSKSTRKQKVKEVLAVLNISDKGNKRINELSGGERQRVAIARALVHSPELIIADEPTANLDSKTSRTIIEEMKNINTRQMVTFIFATHDSMILEYVNKKYTIIDGNLRSSHVH